MVRMQSVISELITMLSTSLPIAIRVVSGQLLTNNTNVTTLESDLDQLTKTIEELNRAMDNVQNETKTFSNMIEATEVVVPVFSKEILMKLRQSLVNLSQLMMSLPNNMHAMFSLIYNIKGWLTNKVYKFYGKEITMNY